MAEHMEKLAKKTAAKLNILPAESGPDPDEDLLPPNLKVYEKFESKSIAFHSKKK